MLPRFSESGQASIRIALNRPKGLRKAVWNSFNVSSLLKLPIRLYPTTLKGDRLPDQHAVGKEGFFSEQTD